MDAKQVPTELPPSLYRFFWDVDAKAVNPSTRPYYVINRLLDKGNMEAARWILRSFSKKAIITSLNQGPRVDPPTAAFWSSYLKISQGKIATNSHFRRKPDLQLWPFGNLN